METKKLEPLSIFSLGLFFLVLGGSLFAVISWIIQTKASLSGFWSLPLGLLQLEITISSLLISLLGGLIFRRKIFISCFLINLLLLFSPYSLSASQSAKGISILSWNVSGTKKQTETQQEKLPCITSYLSEWKKGKERQIILLQEVPKSHKTHFERELDMKCTWSHYLCEDKNCNGLLTCADHDWKINRERQRPFRSGQRYGFQQLELEDKPTNQKINVLNIHLESLWRTIASFPNIKRSGTPLEMLRDNPNPKLLLKVLEKNAQNQRIEIDEVFEVLNQLQDPTLFAGDFNSPPSLWIHRALREQYQDAHVKTGNGFGHTTSRFDVLQARIDYLYASAQLNWTGNTTVDHSTLCSDHFPVQSSFSW